MTLPKCELGQWDFAAVPAAWPTHSNAHSHRGRARRPIRNSARPEPRRSGKGQTRHCAAAAMRCRPTGAQPLPYADRSQPVRFAPFVLEPRHSVPQLGRKQPSRATVRGVRRGTEMRASAGAGIHPLPDPPGCGMPRYREAESFQRGFSQKLAGLWKLIQQE